MITQTMAGQIFGRRNLKMFPSNTEPCIVDSFSRYSQFLRPIFITFTALANFYNQRISKFCVRRFPVGVSFMTNAIIHIVHLISTSQMVRINTRRIIANKMANDLVTKIPVDQFKHKPGSEMGASVIVNPSVSQSVSVSLPFPTITNNRDIVQALNQRALAFCCLVAFVGTVFRSGFCGFGESNTAPRTSDGSDNALGLKLTMVGTKPTFRGFQGVKGFIALATGMRNGYSLIRHKFNSILNLCLGRVELLTQLA